MHLCWLMNVNPRLLHASSTARPYSVDLFGLLRSRRSSIQLQILHRMYIAYRVRELMLEHTLTQTHKSI